MNQDGRARGDSRRLRYTLAVLLLAAIVVAVPAAARTGAPAANGKDLWKHVGDKPAATKGGKKAAVKAKRAEAFTLDRAGVAALLAGAPQERKGQKGLVVSIPAPDGTLQRFALAESSVLQPAAAAAHPEIKTYVGTGVDDPAATIRADLTPLGFHASVRAPSGAYYVDPYYEADESVYVSYFTRDAIKDEELVEGEEIKDADGADAVTALAGSLPIPVGPSVSLRTYRLALITDPSYATYFGAENVTAAKVTLVNRVTQIYEDEMAVRLVLVAETDKTNLNTDAVALGSNGPCGTAPCYTTSSSGVSQFTAGCTSALLGRTRFVLGQIIGASNYDVGHIGLGLPGGGVASLNAAGGNAKAQGCTGLPTPVGDYFAVDYVAHEMGHQFGGNHTFNGNQWNCGGNKAAPSVEPGSGSSIMAYAGICRNDNLQPHSDPYWSQWSYQEIMAYITSERPAINEVQNAALRSFDTDGDAFALAYGGSKTAPFVRGTNYSQTSLQLALQGVSEVQRVTLVGYDTNGDSYRLAYGGSQSVPIVRGQNNTTAGIAAALTGGNEQQQVTLTGFNPATTAYRVKIGDSTSGPIGLGGVSVSNGNIAATVNAIPGFAGTVSSSGAGNSGFTLTFAGASAGLDVPSIEIVECACTSVVRETVKGSAAPASWPAGGTVAVGSLTDTGYTLTFGGTHQGTDVGDVSVTDAIGATGAAAEIAKGSPGILPLGATATVTGYTGSGTANDTGFQVTFGGTLAGVNVASLAFVDFVGADGFVGETAKGGPIQNAGFTIADNGNHAPVVTAPAGYVIPIRTPFALTGSATDSDGDTVSYMWEQTDRGGGLGTALVDNNKVNGPLFRQFGLAAPVSATDTLLTPSPGLNTVGIDPTRTFPDLQQILDGNTNAESGGCNPFTSAWPITVPLEDIDCYSEFLPTAAYVGVAGVNAAPASLNFRLTVRDHRPGGAGIGSADTRLTLTPTAGPFLVTSQAEAATYDAGSSQTVTWDVAGTNLPPVGTESVKISLSTDGGLTYPHVLAAATANDGSASVTIPNSGTDEARIKVEANGNVFFDISPTDVAVRDAATQLTALEAYVTGKGPGKSLANKVQSAGESMAAGRNGEACSTLAGLLNEVRAQTGKTITAAQATQIAALVAPIRTALGC